MTNWLRKFFGNIAEVRKAPVMVISKDSIDIKEYESIEQAFNELEKDPNVPKEKIERLKSSINKLRKRGVIKIQNGEII